MEPRINIMSTETGSKIVKRLMGIGQAINQSPLSPALRELVQLRVSQINGCAACVDMHTKEALAAGESAHRLNMVAVWPEATVFSAAERTALALAEEGTRLADAHRGVSDDTWAQAREHFDDEEISALVTVIAFINAANTMNIMVQMPGGAYEPGMAAAAHA